MAFQKNKLKWKKNGLMTGTGFVYTTIGLISTFTGTITFPTA
jgi:hypothetical protein